MQPHVEGHVSTLKSCVCFYVRLPVFPETEMEIIPLGGREQTQPLQKMMMMHEAKLNSVRSNTVQSNEEANKAWFVSTSMFGM